MAELTKGDLPNLILAVLLAGPQHGYGLARQIEQASSQMLTAREGSLYPALRVLEQEGLVVAAWEIQPSGPARKCYTITDAGREAAVRRTEQWREYVRAVESIVGRVTNAELA